MLLQLQLRQQQPWLCRLFRKNNVQNKLFHNDRLVTIPGFNTKSWLLNLLIWLHAPCASLRMIYDLLS